MRNYTPKQNAVPPPTTPKPPNDSSPSNVDNNPDLSNLNQEEVLWLSHETSLSKDERAKRVKALRDMSLPTTEKLVRPRAETHTT